MSHFGPLLRITAFAVFLQFAHEFACMKMELLKHFASQVRVSHQTVHEDRLMAGAREHAQNTSVLPSGYG
jgi:hypothetical protein